MILGLDVSTTVIGIALYSDHLEKTAFLKFKPKATKFDKWKIVEELFLNLKKDYQITSVFIEEALLMFKKGKSSAKVLASLRGMNDVVSWISMKIFEIEPQYIGATKARSLNKIQKIDDENGKQAAFRFVRANEPSFLVEKNRIGNVKKEMLDVSDAIVIARAGKILLSKQSKN